MQQTESTLSFKSERKLINEYQLQNIVKISSGRSVEYKLRGNDTSPFERKGETKGRDERGINIV